MTSKDIREREILSIKRKLAKGYTCFMATVIAGYAVVFAFYIKDQYLLYYTAFGSILLLLFLSLLFNRINLNKLVMFYLLIAPIYYYYIVIRFWELSVASFVWLLPIPFGAYIFFKRKGVIFYTLYAIFTIILSFFLAYLIDIRLPLETAQKIRYCDTSIIVINFLVISFLVYYKNKIREIEIIGEIEEKEKIILPISLDEKDLYMFENIFSNIETYILEKQNFKDSNLTLSAVSNYLNINTTYISKAIRYKDYQNFNHYINYHRINHAKGLMDTVDMNKVTLLYIYTESGFKSQTTFNRVFKQIEGITPSEYIKNTELV